VIIKRFKDELPKFEYNVFIRYGDKLRFCGMGSYITAKKIYRQTLEALPTYSPEHFKESNVVYSYKELMDSNR
jgi:hypothetical protein